MIRPPFVVPSTGRDAPRPRGSARDVPPLRLGGGADADDTEDRDVVADRRSDEHDRLQAPAVEQPNVAEVADTPLEQVPALDPVPSEEDAPSATSDLAMLSQFVDADSDPIAGTEVEAAVEEAPTVLDDDDGLTDFERFGAADGSSSYALDIDEEPGDSHPAARDVGSDEPQTVPISSLMADGPEAEPEAAGETGSVESSEMSDADAMDWLFDDDEDGADLDDRATAEVESSPAWQPESAAPAAAEPRPADGAPASTDPSAERVAARLEQLASTLREKGIQAATVEAGRDPLGAMIAGYLLGLAERTDAE